MIKQMLLAAAFCFSITTLAQVRCVDLLPDAKKRLRENIGYLASDELEGRAPGTKGIELAAQHILKEFKVLQLSPYVGDDFRQEFDISVAVEFTPQNGLAINGKPLQINEDFYPTQHSS